LVARNPGRRAFVSVTVWPVIDSRVPSRPPSMAISNSFSEALDRRAWVLTAKTSSRSDKSSRAITGVSNDRLVRLTVRAAEFFAGRTACNEDVRSDRQEARLWSGDQANRLSHRTRTR
jgi:hypothetical protein